MHCLHSRSLIEHVTVVILIATHHDLLKDTPAHQSADQLKDTPAQQYGSCGQMHWMKIERLLSAMLTSAGLTVVPASGVNMPKDLCQ